MKSYNIPINYQSSQTMEVKANSLQEAVELALKEFLSIPDENYLCDSYEIDYIVREDYPNEYLDVTNL